MATELMYPHLEFFEWLERAGSYGVLLSLWFILETPTKQNHLVYRSAGRDLTRNIMQSD
jgi:hypothetical protein